MPSVPPTRIIEIALWRLAQGGLHATTTAEIARLVPVSTGHFFRTFPTKQALLDACYAYVVAQLAAPLLGEAGQVVRGERLRTQLLRWWQLSAQVALAQPHYFDYWRLYRTQPRPAGGGAAPLLGPFEPVPELMQRAVARSPWRPKQPFVTRLLGPSLAGQWTAAVDLVLSDAATRGQPAQATQVLEQAFAGWWQGLGLSDLIEVEPPGAKPPVAKPAPAVSPFWQALTQQLQATGVLSPPAPKQ